MVICKMGAQGAPILETLARHLQKKFASLIFRK
jgi:hypothetical protein